MAYDIGPRIGIEGEKQFRDELNSINTTMRTLKTEMESVASQFDKNDKSTEAYVAKNKVLNKQIETQTEKLEKLKKGLSDATDKFGEGDNKTQRWQQAVNKATTDLNKFQRELNQNVDAIDNFGDEVEEVTKKSNKFSGAVSKMGSGVAGVGKAAIGATVTGIKAIGTTALSAAAGMVALTESTKEYRQDISKFEQNINDSGNSLDEMKSELAGLTALTGEADSSIEALSNLMAVGLNDDQMGAAVEALSGAIIKFPDTLKIESLADGLQETLATGQAVGPFAELIERMGGSLEEFNGQLAGATTEAEKNQVALNWLAESGLTKVSEQYKVANEEMLNAAESQFEMNDSLAELADVVEPTVNLFKGGFTRVLKNLVGMITGAEGATDGFKNSVNDLATNAVNTISQMLPTVSATLETLLPTLVSSIAGIMPEMVVMGASLIITFVESLVGVIPDMLPMLITAAFTLISMFSAVIIEQGPTLIQTGVAALVQLIEGLVDALPQLIEMGLVLILALVDALLSALPELIPAAIEAIVVIAEGLINALPKLIEAAPEVITALVKALIENLPLLLDAALEILIMLVSMIIENLPMIAEASAEIIAALLTGLLALIPELVEWVDESISAISKKFGDYDWKQLGKDIIAGIKDGVTSAAAGLGDSVVNAAASALDSAKSFLGIKSPSRLFRDEVGGQIGAGMIAGIDESTRNVSNLMRNVSREMSDSFHLDLSTSSNSVLGVAGGGDINVNIPLKLGNKEITRSTSKVQYGKNKSRSRAKGVVRYYG